MELTGVITPQQSEYLDKLMARESEVKKRESQELDQDAFMTILTTQLQYQDPLSPLDNKDFIAQMTQFASLEKLTGMSEAMQASAVLTAESNEKLTSLEGMLEALQANTEAIASLKTEQTEMKETNVEILNELIKMNQALGAYD
jgi:flagellar basal-body rod modification protein FlgD